MIIRLSLPGITILNIIAATVVGGDQARGWQYKNRLGRLKKRGETFSPRKPSLPRPFMEPFMLTNVAVLAVAETKVATVAETVAEAEEATMAA